MQPIHPQIAELIAAGPVVTDGAWGTALQARGLEPGTCPEAWNLRQRDRVVEVAASYVAAGSQIILTNTFGANRITLADYDLADQAVDINTAGVEISRQAAGAGVQVFASIGPSGKMLVTGQVSEAQLAEAFTEQAQALATAGADGLVIETMTDLTEAKLAVEARPSNRPAGGRLDGLWCRQESRSHGDGRHARASRRNADRRRSQRDRSQLRTRDRRVRAHLPAISCRH